jgi:8-oxo-dGTP pyrophosphatase MutT (NUDIX family)
MAHIHELIDFIVSVYIVNNDKVLLVDHKKLKLWLPIGGHIELNEDTDEALFREVKEECGLKIKVLGTKPDIQSAGTKFLYAPKFLDLHKISDAHKHVGLIYFAESESDRFVFNKEEHNDIKWFSEEDLENPVFEVMPSIKFYAKEALKTASK